MFQTRVVDELKTHILCSVTFCPKNPAFYEIMSEKWWSQGGRRFQSGGALRAG
jgi:hypothetical protein